MNKRGQLSIFLVLGIVIIIAIFVGIYFRGAFVKSVEEAKLAEREALTLEEKAVAKLVDDCLQRTLENGVLKVVRNGGYYPAAEGAIEYLGFEVPLYLDNGKENIPDVSDYERSLENYVDENLEGCISDVEVLERPKSEVSIGKNVKAEVVMLVKVKESRLKNFLGEVNVDLNPPINNVNELYVIAKRFTSSKDMLELGKFLESNDHEYFYEFIDNTSLYIQMFDDALVDEKPLMFSFGIRQEISDELLIDLPSFPSEESEEKEFSEEDRLAELEEFSKDFGTPKDLDSKEVQDLEASVNDL